MLRWVLIVGLSLLVAGGLLVLPEAQIYRDREFVLAAYNGNLPKMKVMQLLGADVNVWGMGSGYALPGAASQGHTQIVKYLLDQGADVNAEEKFGWTALIDASYNGHTEVVGLLLSHGADVNALCDEGSALRLAQEKGHTEVADLLKQRGARVCRDYRPESCFPVVLKVSEVSR